jgi:hypothetical protein
MQRESAGKSVANAMNAAGESAGNSPEMKNSIMIIIIFKRNFPEKIKSSRNEN